MQHAAATNNPMNERFDVIPSLRLLVNNDRDGSTVRSR